MSASPAPPAEPPAADPLPALAALAAAPFASLDEAINETLALLADLTGKREVLHLIGRGLADKEIATELGTSAKPAQFHVSNLLDKLGAQNRTDAARIGYARGLIGV
ncbi:MAG: response regulator transcription factor [Solirubrobacteraceae bacterium]